MLAITKWLICTLYMHARAQARHDRVTIAICEYNASFTNKNPLYKNSEGSGFLFLLRNNALKQDRNLRIRGAPNLKSEF